MAVWLGTVIEKGQLADGSGHEATGEICSRWLPEEKKVLGEIFIGQGWTLAFNCPWRSIQERVKAPSISRRESGGGRRPK